jgi:hypothetical protein
LGANRDPASLPEVESTNLWWQVSNQPPRGHRYR